MAAAKGDVEQESLLVLAAVRDILAALGTPMSAMVLPRPLHPTSPASSDIRCGWRGQP